MMNAAREYVELFHLLFLDQLSRSLDDSLYAVKGGCNLRFFFNSVRYSEDLDIDVKIIAVETLKNKMNRILTAVPFQQILSTLKITIENITSLKQTTTTQRWKLILKTPLPLVLNTKIEFSRRGIQNDSVLYESINSSILRYYQLTPVLCPHYSKEFAFLQKIEALVGRPQTQARDIFDLFFLSKVEIDLEKIMLFKKKNIAQAIHNITSITFSDFQSQVVSFLSPEYQRQYDSKKIWEKMVSDVIIQLECLQK